MAQPISWQGRQGFSESCKQNLQSSRGKFVGNVHDSYQNTYKKVQGVAWGTVYYAEGNDSYQNTYKKVQGVAWDMVYMLRVTTPIRIHTKGSGSGLGHCILC